MKALEAYVRAEFVAWLERHASEPLQFTSLGSAQVLDDGASGNYILSRRREDRIFSRRGPEVAIWESEPRVRAGGIPRATS